MNNVCLHLYVSGGLYSCCCSDWSVSHSVFLWVSESWCAPRTNDSTADRIPSIYTNSLPCVGADSTWFFYSLSARGYRQHVGVTTWVFLHYCIWVLDNEILDAWMKWKNARSWSWACATFPSTALASWIWCGLDSWSCSLSGRLLLRASATTLALPTNI